MLSTTDKIVYSIIAIAFAISFIGMGIAILKSYHRGWKDVDRRNRGKGPDDKD